MKKEEAIKRLEIIVAASKNDIYKYEIKSNNWEKKNGAGEVKVSRTYFAIVETRGNSKHYNEKRFGYMNNLTGEYIPEKYGDLTKNYTFGGMKF